MKKSSKRKVIKLMLSSGAGLCITATLSKVIKETGIFSNFKGLDKLAATITTWVLSGMVIAKAEDYVEYQVDAIFASKDAMDEVLEEARKKLEELDEEARKQLEKLEKAEE